ncbi:MAG: ATP-binding protein [bacterium]|nr:ATP-binding protein [bacterium]
MNYYVFIPLVGFTINLFTWTYTFSQRHNNSINRSCLLITGCLAVWSLTDFTLWLPAATRLWVPLLKIALSIGFLTNFCLLHFIYSITQRNKDFLYYTTLSCVSLSAILNISTNSYVNGYEIHGWGISYIEGSSFFYITFINVLPILYSTYIIFNEIKKTSHYDTNSPYPRVFLGLLVLSLSLLISHLVFPYILKINHPVQLSFIATVIQSVFICSVVSAHNARVTQKELQESRNKLESLASELAQASASLEKKVVERTGSLLKSNEQLRCEIIERRRAEEVLATEKEQLAVTLSSIGDGVIATDTSGNIVLLNKVAETLTGWSQAEAIKQPLSTIFQILDEKNRQPCQNPADAALHADGHVHRADQLLLIARDGTERLIAANAAPIRAKDEDMFGAVLVFWDMTARRHIEEELMKADKLDSIGLLAGGVAHDFNNILTAIIGNISLAKIYAEKEGKVFARLVNAEKAALQAQNLTQQLLTISKDGSPIRQPASIDHVIRDCIDFSLRGSNVRCEFGVDHHLWPVEVDQGQISQVINNLMINADQAMPDGGRIDVQVENVTLDADDIDRHIALEPGKYVKISVQDNGIGIPEDRMSKIFDPYFTTKQAGNGLGLFTCYSIIKKHHGHLSVASQQGVGTTFEIYLPASEQQVGKQLGKQMTHYPGKGKILIMEDDETIREVTGEMLMHLGYDVTFARDGAEAIALYRREKDADAPFEVVVLDLTVPGGMGGEQAIKKLLKIDPQTKAIVASGYTTDPIMAQFEHYGFCDRIVKPYKSEELHAVLYKVMKTPPEVQSPPSAFRSSPSAI